MSASSVAAVLRISRRNIGRNRWRSALVVLLVMLPVASMVGGITYLRTTTPTPEAYATDSLGTADFLVEPIRTGPASGPVSTVATGDRLRSLLPDGARVEVITYADGVVVLPGRKVAVTIRSLDLEGLAAGILQLTAGRLPVATSEVAITPAVAAIANAEIGDRIALEDSGQVFIVGLVESPILLSSRVVLRDPSMAEAPGMEPHSSFLVELPSGAELPELGPEFSVQSREQWAGSGGDATLGMLVFGGLALIEMILIASAAFAVSIRRRQRELGILAASGAQPRHLAGTVLGEGLLLGGLAALIGAVVGVSIVFGLSPWLDQLTDRRNPPVTLDGMAIGLAALIGLLAAVLAAAVPAWTAARLPALVALSGRRPAATSARRTLVLGVGLIVLSVILTVTGASIILQRAGAVDAGAGFMLAGGAIIGVLGFGACSPWLVERLEWIGRRLPLSARMALRDTARARSRSAPIITAMLASLAAAIAISAGITSTSAAQEASWRPWLRPYHLFISGLAPEAGRKLAGKLNAVASAPMTQLVPADGKEREIQLAYSLSGASPRVGVLDPSAGQAIECDDCWFTSVMIGDEQLLTTLGAESALDAFRDGAVVVLAEGPINMHDAAIRVDEPTGRLDDRGLPEMQEWLPKHVEVVPATAVSVGLSKIGRRLPGAVIPLPLALRLGFTVAQEVGAEEFLVRLDHQVTEADIAAAAALLANAPNAYVEGPLRPVPPPTQAARSIIFLLSLFLALTVTAIAVALAEAEARADQRTLLAVGADPGIRRRVIAARAAVLALVAALLAVPAGLLPVWGVFASRDGMLVAPLPEIIGVVLLLPAVGAVGALVLSRPIPVWSAFRDVSAQ